MKLIDDLVQELTSPSANIESALLKTQVLAHQLGDADLKRWVDSEIKGYSEDAEIPPYRVSYLTLMGTVSNGYWRHSDRILPVLHLDEKIRDKLTVRQMRDSIAVISELAKPDKNFAVSIQPEYYHFLSKNFSDGYEIEDARGIHAVGAMIQIVTQVKSRLLDFVLALSDQVQKEPSPSELREIAGDIGVNEMFRNSVFGDNTTIVVGSGSVQGTTNTIIHNNFESLAGFLRTKNVKEEDISDLESAISSDKGAAEIDRHEVGPRVKEWKDRMLVKAGTAGWQITAETAGNLLAAAISAFYGFNK